MNFISHDQTALGPACLYDHENSPVDMLDYVTEVMSLTTRLDLWRSGKNCCVRMQQSFEFEN